MTAPNNEAGNQVALSAFIDSPRSSMDGLKRNIDREIEEERSTWDSHSHVEARVDPAHNG